MDTSTKRYLSSDREGAFPDLTRDLYRVTSDETEDYNCIAYAAGDMTRWWWPDPFGDYFWPASASRAETLECFVEMYQTFGYQKCDHGEAEPGFEKVAIYIDPFGTSYTPIGMPTHAARQLDSGIWTSKLGGWEDIEHLTLECLGGKGAYGRPSQFLKRRTVS